MSKKKCFVCKRELDLSNFHKNKKNYDGLHSYCKECFREYLKERSLHEDKKEANARKLKWEKNNRDKRRSIERTYGKKVTEALKDRYIINSIRVKTGMSIESIKDNPMLIEAQRKVIEIKREIKKKNIIR